MQLSKTSTWSDAYLKGVIDLQAGKLDEKIVKELAYYLQTNLIIRNPDCMLYFDDMLLDDPAIYEKHEAYTKGALETSDEQTFKNLSYIFLQSASDAIEDYEIEASHLDHNFEGLQFLEYIDLNYKTKTIEVFATPETKQYFDSHYKL